MEFDKPAHLHPGHIVPTSSLRLDLWRLLTIFLADRAFATLTEPEFHADGYAQPLMSLQSEFEEDEITRILIGTAITLRVLDDRDGLLNSDMYCGTLEINGGNTPLTLREACNKIVHATKVNFDLERLDGGPIEQLGMSPPYLTPNIYFYGSLRGADWRATLDVIAYVHAAASLV